MLVLIEDGANKLQRIHQRPGAACLLLQLQALRPRERGLLNSQRVPLPPREALREILHHAGQRLTHRPAVACPVGDAPIRRQSPVLPVGQFGDAA